MKIRKSKRELRNELSAQVENFLQTGGEVKTIPTGTSGNESNTNLFRSATQFEPKSDRTPLNEVVKALEERKGKKTQSQPPKRRPQKRLIVDDFGDPVRWVWDD